MSNKFFDDCLKDAKQQQSEDVRELQEEVKSERSDTEIPQRQNIQIPPDGWNTHEDAIFGALKIFIIWFLKNKPDLYKVLLFLLLLRIIWKSD
jgi:hypothetical protein